ncbi:MAG: ABC transporter ATP-binding protein [Chloroflexota bacterium]
MAETGRKEPLVYLQEVSKIYPGAGRPAVDQVSLKLYPGEILALLGPNGAGKTTTVKMTAGLVLPTTGMIRVLGHEMVRERIKGVRHIGAVLEGTRNLYWRLSARENLLYFGGLRLVPHRELNYRIDKLLALFDLSEHQDRDVRHFSRGMQQKLALVAALLHDPEVLLLDEPTLGLDVQAARRLEETIMQLAREQGKAILLTTHVMALAEKLADRIFVIYKGRQVAYDSTSTLLEQYNMERDTTDIQVAGLLPEALVSKIQTTFPDVTIMLNGETTTLAWSSPEQAAVIRLLQLLDQHRVTILNVGRRQATLEEVFLSLTEGEVS